MNPSLLEKQQQFVQYATILSQKFGLSVVFGSDPAHGPHVRLPALDNLSERDIDFLYTVTLREMGFMMKSKRNLEDLLDSTKNTLDLAYMIESARIENMLHRKFAGAKERFQEFWNDFGTDPAYVPLTVKKDSTEWNLFDTFCFMSMWTIRQRPKTVHASRAPHWNEVLPFFELPEVTSLLEGTILRSWKDVVALTEKMMPLWTAFSHVPDASPKLIDMPGAGEELKKIHQYQQTLAALQQTVQAHKDELKAKNEDIATRERDAFSDEEWEQYQDVKKRIQEATRELRQFSSMREMVADLERNNRTMDNTQRAQQNTLQRIAEEQNKQNLRKQAVQSRMQDSLNKKNEKLDQVGERFQDKEERLTSQIQDLQNKKDELAQQLDALQQQMEALQNKDKRTASEQKKLDALPDKIQKNQEAQAARQEAIDNKQQQINDLHQELEQRRQEAQNDVAARQQREEAKVDAGREHQKQQSLQQDLSSLTQQLNQLRQTQQSLEQQMAQEAKKQGLDMKALQDALKKMNDSRAEKKPFQGREDGFNQERKKARDDYHQQMQQHSHDAFKEAQSFQESMKEQGVNVDLVPEFQEIEGWDAANDIQQKFDEQASQSSGESVINGRGGGVGGRNLDTWLQRTMDGVHDIDPHTLFQDVLGTSLLDNMGHPSDPDALDSTDTQGLDSAVKHSVWRKDLDSILTLGPSDPSAARALRQEHKMLGKKVTDMLMKYLRPSFKQKFRGGREDGMLDARNIWKLAANKGDDYYEDIIKKPDNKMCASIVVDVSGSLASWGSDTEKYLQTMTTLLSDALTACHIEHEIITHSAPMQAELMSSMPSALPFNRKGCSLDLKIIKGFKNKDFTNVKSISLTANDNADNEALREAFKRIRKHPAKERLIFVIGDGKPFMFDADPSILDADLRQCAAEMARQKVRLISLGQSLDHAVLPNHVCVPDIELLPMALEKAFAPSKTGLANGLKL